jgi:hypothetical protein
MSTYARRVSSRLAVTACLAASLAVTACIDPPKPWVPPDASDAALLDAEPADAQADAQDGAAAQDIPSVGDTTPDAAGPEVDCGERLAPTPGRIDGGQQLCPDEAASDITSLELPDGGTPPFAYRWERRFWVAGEAALDEDFEVVEGATDPERLDLPDAPPDGSFAYRRVVIDACGAEAASEEVVVEATPLSGGAVRGPDALCDQATARVEAVTPASGGRGGVTYGWARKVGTGPWEVVDGETGDSVTTPPAEGGVTTTWRRLATNACRRPTQSNDVAIAGHAPLRAGRITGPETVCSGEAELTLAEVAPASGGDGPTVTRWERRASLDGAWEVIEGASTASLRLDAALTDSAIFSRVDSNGCGEVRSNEVSVEVVGVPMSHTTSSDQTLCPGAAASPLTVTYAGAEGPISYQWLSSADGAEFTEIPLATRATFTPPPPSAPIWYRRRTLWACGATLSRPIQVAPFPELEAGAVGDGQALCADAPAERLREVTAPAGGDGSYRFLWQQRPAGATQWSAAPNGASAELEPGLPAGPMDYRRLVTDGCGTEAATPPVRLEVATQLDPGLLRGPQVLCRGAEATPLESQRPASGGLGGTTFRWEASVGGAPFMTIEGATGETYAPGLLTVSTQFRRRAINRCGEASTASVAIQLRPSFQPGVVGANQTICHSGLPARLESLTAPSGGAGFFLYRWERQRGSEAWAALSGASDQALDVPRLDTTTRFRRHVREDTCGHEGTSNEVVVTVASPFSAGSIAAPTLFCAGRDVTIASDADAVGGLGATTYGWQRLGSGGWESIAGAAGATLTWRSATGAETFRRFARNTCGEAPTAPVEIAPAEAVSAGVISGEQRVCTASEVGPLQSVAPGRGGVPGGAYRWESSLDGVTWEVVPGATEAALTPVVTQTSRLRRVFANACGEAATAPVTVTVDQSVDPGVITAATEVCPGLSPGLITGTTADVGAGASVSYGWQRLDEDGRWRTLAGAFARDLDPGPLTRTTSFRRVVASPCGEVASNTVVVTVPERAAGVIAAPTEPVCHGAQVTIASRAPAAGLGEIGYTWEALAPGGAWVGVMAATAASAEVADLREATTFRRVATDRCGRLETAQVEVTVRPALMPGRLVLPSGTCHNRSPAPVASEEPASGGSGSFSYAWERREGATWRSVAGLSEPSLTLTEPQTASSTWRRRVDDTVCGQSATTADVEVAVAAPLTAGAIGGAASLCLGEAAAPLVEVTPAAGGLGALTWSWQRSPDGSVWDLIPGADGAELPAPDATVSARYRRLATNACGTVVTEPVVVEVAPALTSGTIGEDQRVCAGAPASALADLTPPSGGSGRYSWRWEAAAGACTSGATCAPPLVVGGATSGTARIAWSDDAGVSWIASQHPAGAAVTSLEASPTAVLAVLDDKVLRSTDGGRTFAEVSVPISRSSGPRVTALTWRGGRWFAGGRAQIARSLDDGATWQLVYPADIGLPPTNTQPFLAFAVRGQEVVAAAAGEGPYYFVRSVNNGLTWDTGIASTPTNMPGSGASCSHVIIDASATRYFAGASSVCNGVVQDAADLWTNTASFAGGTWDVLSAPGFTPRFWGLGVASDGDAMFLGGSLQTAVNRVAWLAAGSSAPVVRSIPGDGTGTSGASRVVAVGDSWYVVRGLVAGQASLLASRDDGLSWSALTEPGFSVRALAGGYAARPATWSALQGEVAATLTVQDVNTPRTYRRVMRDALCEAEVVSNPVVLSPAPALDAGVLSAPPVVCDSARATVDGSPSVSGLAPITYRWFTQADASSAWTLVEGAASEDLVTAPLAQGAAFRREVSDRCGSSTTAAVSVTVAPPARAGNIIGSQYLCGSEVPNPIVGLEPAEGGVGDGRYVWQVSDDRTTWVDVPDSNSLGYAPPSTTTRKWYRRGWLTACAAVYTDPVFLEPGGGLSAGRIAGDQTVCPFGTPQPLTSESAAGGDAFTYRWQFRQPGGAWINIDGAAGATYQPAPVFATTEFRRLAENEDCGAASSNVVTVSVTPLDAGAIESARTVCQGDIPSPIASVRGASGAVGPYAYTWQSSPLDGGSWTDVTGATGVTLSFDAGVTASVRFRRRAASTCSAAATPTASMTLTVVPPPTPGRITGDQTICDGASAAVIGSAEAATSSDGVITYQWQRRPSGAANFEDIASATAATHAPGAVERTTTYRRKATNGCFSTTSNEVSVTVAPRLDPGTIVATQTICHDTSAQTLTTGVAPSGGRGGFTWRWESSTDGTSFTPVSGATGESLSPGRLTRTTHFKRVNINACGSSMTPAVIVTVRAPLEPGAIAASQNICHDRAPATFTGTAPAGGSGNFGYQWQVSGVDGQWTDLQGATAATWTASPLTDSRRFRRSVRDTTCDATAPSNEVVVTVAQPVSAGAVGTATGASAQTVCSGKSPAAFVTLTPASGGLGALTWAWEEQTGGQWRPLASATTESFQPAATTPATETVRDFRRVARSATCDASSVTLPVTLTVRAPLSAGSINGAQTICSGAQPTELTSAAPPAGGTGGYSYQWQQSVNNGTSWTDIPAATSASFAPAPLTTTTRFRRKVSDSACGDVVLTEPVIVTVRAPLLAGTIGGPTERCSGQAVEAFTNVASASGGAGTYTYRWETSRDGTNWTAVTGVATAGWSQPSIAQTTHVRRRVIDGVCVASFATAPATTIHTVQVGAPLEAGNIAASQTLCASGGGLIGFSSVQAASGGLGALAYQWYARLAGEDLSPVIGGDSLIWSPTEVLATTEFVRRVTNRCGTADTAPIAITVRDPVEPGLLGGSQVVCQGAQAPTLEPTEPSGGGKNFSFQWQQSLDEDPDDFQPLLGENGRTFKPTDTSTSRWYRRVVTEATCSEVVATEPIFVAISSDEPGAIETTDDQLCPGDLPPLILSADDVPGAAYSWESSTDQQNWTVVPDARDRDLQPDGLLTSTTSWRRTATTTCGKATTTPVTVEVLPALPRVPGTASPAQTVCPNVRPSTLSVLDDAGAPFNPSLSPSQFFVWQHETDVGWRDIPGADGATFRPEVLSQTTRFRRVIRDAVCGSEVASSDVRITVDGAPGSIAANPAERCAAAGATVELKSIVGASGAVSYTWELKSASGGWQTISGAARESLEVSASTPGSFTYRRGATSAACGSVASNEVTVLVVGGTSAGGIEAPSSFACFGKPPDELKSTAPAAGSVAPAYVWEVSEAPPGTPNRTWSDAGGRAESFTPPVIEASGGTGSQLPTTITRYYRRRANFGGCGGLVTSGVSVTYSGCATTDGQTP